MDFNMVFNRLIYLVMFFLPSLVLSADSSHGSAPHLNGEELAILELLLPMTDLQTRQRIALQNMDYWVFLAH